MRESPKARQAWADYLALGEGRSLEKLAATYRTATEPPPTKQIDTLKEWSRSFGWQSRLQAIADAAAAEATAAIYARRREALETGLALDHERVDALKGLARRLLDEVDKGRLWLPDVKAIGSGENAERVDIERFNGSLVEQLRGALDDIAKEKGERVKKLEHSGPGGVPVVFTLRLSNDDGDGDRTP